MGEKEDGHGIEDLEDQVGDKHKQTLHTRDGHHPENAQALGKGHGTVKKGYTGVGKSQAV